MPTELNPADHASRGLTVKQLIREHEWLQGPDFLYHAEEDWPMTSKATTDEDSVPDSTVVVNTLKQTSISDDKITVNKLIEHYSDWTGLKRAVVWWLRLKKLLQQRVSGTNIQHVTGSRCLTAADLEESEVAILTFVQQQSFPA